VRRIWDHLDTCESIGSRFGHLIRRLDPDEHEGPASDGGKARKEIHSTRLAALKVEAYIERRRLSLRAGHRTDRGKV